MSVFVQYKHLFTIVYNTFFISFCIGFGVEQREWAKDRDQDR